MGNEKILLDSEIDAARLMMNGWHQVSHYKFVKPAPFGYDMVALWYTNVHGRDVWILQARTRTGGEWTNRVMSESLHEIRLLSEVYFK